VIEQDTNYAALYLPYGGVVESFTPSMTDEVDQYISKHGRSWYIQCNVNPRADKRYPLLITSAWLAKSFACATYVRPSYKRKTSRHAELSRVQDQERLIWNVDDGIYYMTAPLDNSAYDKDGKLKSADETECFALSAKQICPESLMERSGALLSPGGGRRMSNATF